VYVGDVVRAMVASIVEAESYGKRYDLGGPRVYTLRELVELVCALTGRRRPIIGLSERLSLLQAAALEWSPGPMMSRDNVRSMREPNVCPAGVTLPFGLVPHAVEAIAPAWLGQGDPRERYPQLRWRARR
jgi:NADH dehydrogenase